MVSVFIVEFCSENSRSVCLGKMALLFISLVGMDELVQQSDAIAGR